MRYTCFTNVPKSANKCHEFYDDRIQLYNFGTNTNSNRFFFFKIIHWVYTIKESSKKNRCLIVVNTNRVWLMFCMLSDEFICTIAQFLRMTNHTTELPNGVRIRCDWSSCSPIFQFIFFLHQHSSLSHDVAFIWRNYVSRWENVWIWNDV